MTAGHGNGSEALRHDVDGQQDGNGIQETAEVFLDTGGLDLVVCNVHEDDKTPSKLGHQVSGGTPYTDQADQVGDNAGCEDGKDQRNVIVKIGTHVATDKIDDCIVSHFCHCLLPGDAGNSQSGTQPDQHRGDDDHDQQCSCQSLGDLDITEQG